MGHRFTIAEDEENFSHFLHMLLVRTYSDASFALFSTAEDALQHILNTGTDILITDHGMAAMTGTDLIYEIRQRGINIPIIMISGNPKQKEPALAAGATDFLDKSLEFETMTDHIHRLVTEIAGKR